MDRNFLAGTSATAAEEFRRSFAVVLAAAVGMYVSVTHLYSMGVMMQPIEEDTGWSRMQISSGLTVISFVSVILAPIVGIMIDRWGPRRIACYGVVVYCGALAGLSAVGMSVWTWWLAWLGLAAGSVLVKPTVWTAAVASHFKTARGMALGLTLCGAGLAAAAVPPVTGILLGIFSWRGAYLTLALCSAVALLPLVYFFFDSSIQLSTIKSTANSGGPTVGVMMRTRPFICLALSGFFVTVAVTALVVHFVPLLLSKGATREMAVNAASLIGVSSIIGRLGTGALLDRFGGRIIGALTFALPALCAGALLSCQGESSIALVAAGALGLTLGAELDVIIYMCAGYFGLGRFGVIFGTIAGLLSLAAGIGPLVAGGIFDRYRSYDVLIIGLMPLVAISVMLMVSARPPARTVAV